MKQIHFNRFTSFLDSFEAGTKKEIHTPTITVKLDRMNSPHKSKPEIVFSEPTSPNETMLVMVRKEEQIVIFPNWHDQSKIRTNYVKIDIPAYLVKEAFVNANLGMFIPEFVKHGGVITAYIPDYFSGYDDEKKPMFSAEPYFSINIGDEENVVYADVPIFDRPTDRPKRFKRPEKPMIIIDETAIGEEPIPVEEGL